MESAEDSHSSVVWMSQPVRGPKHEVAGIVVGLADLKGVCTSAFEQHRHGGSFPNACMYLFIYRGLIVTTDHDR